MIVYICFKFTIVILWLGELFLKMSEFHSKGFEFCKPGRILNQIGQRWKIDVKMCSYFAFRSIARLRFGLKIVDFSPLSVNFTTTLKISTLRYIFVLKSSKIAKQVVLKMYKWIKEGIVC